MRRADTACESSGRVTNHTELLMLACGEIRSGFAGCTPRMSVNGGGSTLAHAALATSRGRHAPSGGLRSRSGCK